MPRSTYYRLRDEDWDEGPGDEIDGAVREEFERSSRRYGARRIKRALAKRGIVASRRRIRRSMRSQGLVSRYQRKSFRPHASKPNEAEVPNVLDREFDGHALFLREACARVVPPRERTIIVPWVGGRGKRGISRQPIAETPHGRPRAKAFHTFWFYSVVGKTAAVHRHE